MWLSTLFCRLKQARRSGRPTPRISSLLAGPEQLESRIVLYAASGNAWANPALVTISFMPDGTSIGGQSSNMFATFNAKFGTAATWQNQILKGAQFWAQQTNLNFAVVSDNGAATGSGTAMQGDPGFGDIRIGGYSFGTSTLAQAYLPPPVNNYSIAGDIQFNTGIAFNIGTTYDLFTVANHEIGHALGLNHSTTSAACMYATYSSVKTALNADDISGIKAIYSAGAARAIDTYDSPSNGTVAAAKVITTSINTTTKTAVIDNLDLTTTTDLDFYKFVVPAGSSTTLKATVVSSGVSLLSPKIEILSSSGSVLATATAGATSYGTTVTATKTGITAGTTYLVKVSSTNATAAFKTGRYSLVLNMGTGADPAITKTTTTTANGSTLTSGGGQAILMTPEAGFNGTTLNAQTTSDRSVASTIEGDYVATWASALQDGSGSGIYARRFDKLGVAQGTEFRVNTTNSGDQLDPAVAMDAFGNFMITWVSVGQDGSGSGIYAQRFSGNGTPLGSEFRVNTVTAGEQTAPCIAADTFGNVVVTWTSDGQDGSGLGVYGQRYNVISLTGTADGTEFRVNNTTAGAQSDSSVVKVRLSGEYIVTWSSVAQDGSGSGIYGQRYSATGSPTGSEFRVNTATANDQTDSQLAVNRLTGEFIVTWTSNLQDGSGTGIYAQRYNAAGVAQGAEFRVNTTTSGAQSDSAVAMDAHGYIFVTWAGASTSNGLQIYGQQFDKLGVKNEGEIVINSTAAGDQKSPAIAIDFKGNTVIVWSGNGAADSAGVFKARYRTDLDTFEAPGSAHHHDHDEEPDALATSASRFASSQPQRLEVPSVSAPNMDRLAPRTNAVRTATASASDVVRREQPVRASVPVAADAVQWQALLGAVEQLTGV